MDVEKLRLQFPQLSERVYGKPLVYLDNAATIQRPQSVIDKWVFLSSRMNSNLHRAVHKIAADATEEYESTRDEIRRYINAAGREEIIFTSGTTASINLLAFCFGEAFVGEGDEIVVSECEHHSNIVPWQMMCERKKAQLKVLPVDDSGHLRIDLLPDLITDRTKLLSVAHISNVLGIVNPLKEIITYCHSKGCPVMVDGAQGIVHEKVDVQDLDCDFYAFSGHKIYAAPGTGVLYGKKQYLEAMPPYMGGGEMIAHVSFEATGYAPLPGKFEAGTQNMAGIPTLKPAVQLAELTRDASVEASYKELRDYVLKALLSDDRIRLYGVPREENVPRGTSEKIALFSFCVKGVHHEDLALILDKMGIATRSGQMCAEPLMDRFAVSGMLRASFAPYNTMEEAQYFIASLNKAIDMLL